MPQICNPHRSLLWQLPPLLTQQGSAWVPPGNGSKVWLKEPDIPCGSGTELDLYPSLTCALRQ